MTSLLLIFIGGLLGSAHCVGMCGGFAIMVGSGATRLSSGLARQMLFSVGRIFTYSLAGAVVGFVGLALAQRYPRLVHLQAALALVAGCLLVAEGLFSAGIVRRPRFQNKWPGCPLGGILGGYLRSPRPLNYLLAGVFTGFLPCGLVYGYLALAAATGEMGLGLLTMLAFGLGTVPLMVLVGSGGAMLTPRLRQRVLKVAAWCVVLTGALSLVRGVTAWQA